MVPPAPEGPAADPPLWWLAIMLLGFVLCCLCGVILGSLLTWRILPSIWGPLDNYRARASPNHAATDHELSPLATADRAVDAHWREPSDLMTRRTIEELDSVYSPPLHVQPSNVDNSSRFDLRRSTDTSRQLPPRLNSFLGGQQPGIALSRPLPSHNGPPQEPAAAGAGRPGSQSGQNPFDRRRSEDSSSEVQDNLTTQMGVSCVIPSGSFCMRKTSSSPRLSVSRKRSIAAMNNWTRARMLGSGTYGKVFVGVREDGTMMAVKVLDISAIRDRVRIVSLEREITLLSSLSHEHIVDYFGCKIDEAHNELQIFMEYVSNGSLGQLVRTIEDPLQESAVAQYTGQILEGVGYLHHHDIVHRDLKGDNILLTHDGTIKISDFGTSKPVSTGDNSMAVQGTPLWSAPEVFGGHYSKEADVWSVGCVVCELLTGHPPWPQFENVWLAIATISKHKEGYPPHLPTPPRVSTDCTSFLQSCLSPKPSERNTIDELKHHGWVAQYTENRDEEEEEEEDEEDEETQTDHAVSHILRRISQINTPTHQLSTSRNGVFPTNAKANATVNPNPNPNPTDTVESNSFIPRTRGRLSSAAQMQYESMLLGEPQVSIRSDTSSLSNYEDQSQKKQSRRQRARSSSTADSSAESTVCKPPPL
ncbi:Mitogen-activated protein kinase kinase kinase 2 [Diplonema papillatum]|nr:Mitogen-activated protein kinase kinase kinase 2 [Diplonema papillatum]